MKKRAPKGRYYQLLDDFDRKVFSDYIKEYKNVVKAANQLEINIGRLYKRCRELGIDVKDLVS